MGHIERFKLNMVKLNTKGSFGGRVGLWGVRVMINLGL